MDRIKSFGIKKLIALVMVFSYVLFTAYSMLYERNIPESFVTATTMILAFYFKVEHEENNKK